MNKNVLLVEPDYRSKFPPLGLLRISSYHRSHGDHITFARGLVPELRGLAWHRVYVSSLFTWELPRTVRTARYYLRSVASSEDLYVGGPGATLLPEYVRTGVPCKLVTGLLDAPRMLGREVRPVGTYLPDYELLDSSPYLYRPCDSYFCRITVGCIRRCRFCAVPRIEPEFGLCDPLDAQLQEVNKKYGERQHLVVMDNNLLAAKNLDAIVAMIRDAGFGVGSKRNGRRRTVDLNQGIDARLVTRDTAKQLSTIALSPVRLAFDSEAGEVAYRRAVHRMVREGFRRFLTYALYNYDDTPLSLYHRMKVSLELAQELGVEIATFPMRFIPMDDVSRRHVSTGWTWRWLRGMQCVLHATHGLVGPNPDFFKAAFGGSYEEFLEILAMPDRYILYRSRHRNDGAAEWKRLFRKLSGDDQKCLLATLDQLHRSRDREHDIDRLAQFRDLVEHYYPDGAFSRGTPT